MAKQETPTHFDDLSASAEVPARAFELRAIGYDIATVWTQGVTKYGRKHRIARHVFRKPLHERHWLEVSARLGIRMYIVLSHLWSLYRYLSRLADG